VSDQLSWASAQLDCAIARALAKDPADGSRPRGNSPTRPPRHCATSRGRFLGGHRRRPAGIGSRRPRRLLPRRRPSAARIFVSAPCPTTSVCPSSIPNRHDGSRNRSAHRGRSGLTAAAAVALLAFRAQRPSTRPARHQNVAAAWALRWWLGPPSLSIFDRQPRRSLEHHNVHDCLALFAIVPTHGPTDPFANDVMRESRHTGERAARLCVTMIDGRVAALS
jgi:hypothetical protein